MGLAFLRECEAAAMPALVACLAGVGRSSTLVLAHLLAGRFAGEGVEAALGFLTARRPVVRPNPEQVEAARLAAFAVRDRG
jgi:protein-tyrosine phosphatase